MVRIADPDVIAHPGQRPAPRRLARIASPPRIMEWWEAEHLRETGREATGRRTSIWWRIVEYLAVNPRLLIEDCRLVASKDALWPYRKTRGPADRVAYRLGAINYPELGERLTYWIAPKSLRGWRVAPPPKRKA